MSKIPDPKINLAFFPAPNSARNPRGGTVIALPRAAAARDSPTHEAEPIAQ